MEVGQTEFFKPNWMDSGDTERFLRRELLTGEVLNFPCGNSPLGDVRADIDPETAPDVIADITNCPFSDDSFDTVYCDPPYSMHAFDKVQWALDLWDVARKRLILQTTTEVYRLPGAEREVYLADKKSSRCFQVFQVFTRPDTRLSDW
jgi:16S rRNA G966 N2-methylase RsmD